MSWVVDTCVIIDIVAGDDAFSAMSADAIDLKRSEGLSIAPITYIELAPSFKGDVRDQNRVLSGLGIGFDFGCKEEVVFAAHQSWYRHILRKRAGTDAKRPVADILIGAYAMQTGGLITRNEADFKALYPSLSIFNPASLAT